MKNQIQFYKKVLEHFKVRPEEAIFVGHDIKEMKGARDKSLYHFRFKKFF